MRSLHSELMRLRPGSYGASATDAGKSAVTSVDAQHLDAALNLRLSLVRKAADEVEFSWTSPEFSLEGRDDIVEAKWQAIITEPNATKVKLPISDAMTP